MQWNANGKNNQDISYSTVPGNCHLVYNHLVYYQFGLTTQPGFSGLGLE